MPFGLFLYPLFAHSQQVCDYACPGLSPIFYEFFDPRTLFESLQRTLWKFFTSMHKHVSNYILSGKIRTFQVVQPVFFKFEKYFLEFGKKKIFDARSTISFFMLSLLPENVPLFRKFWILSSHFIIFFGSKWPWRIFPKIFAI